MRAVLASDWRRRKSGNQQAQTRLRHAFPGLRVGVIVDDTDLVSYVWPVPRTTPPDRYPKLLDAAAAAFVEHGFLRTQMDDIAGRLGVSKGTVYRAVDSKECLFAAVIAFGDFPDQIPVTELEAIGDISAIGAGLAVELVDGVARLELAQVVAGRRRLRADGGFGEEIERATIELYRVMRSRRTAIMVLDRCAVEFPELAAVWYGDGRYALVDLWERYLELRASHVATGIDRAILARTIVEVLTTWAVKMPWDPAPRPYPDDMGMACAAMVRRLVGAG